MRKKVIIVGSGNAALSAGIAALEKGAEVTIYEKGDKKWREVTQNILPEQCDLLMKVVIN